MLASLGASAMWCCCLPDFQCTYTVMLLLSVCGTVSRNMDPRLPPLVGHVVSSLRQRGRRGGEEGVGPGDGGQFERDCLLLVRRR